MIETVNKVVLPWNAWYEDTFLEISFPEKWQVDIFSLRGNKPVYSAQLREEAERMAEILRERRIQSVAIAIDDLTRPMSYEGFFEYLIPQLASWKYPPKVKIIIGLGTHRPLNRQELELKVGKTPFHFLDFVEVINHDYRNDVVPVGLEWGKVPVKVNRHFMEAQYRVVFSAIVPHPFAGFSGGPKMVLPGLSNIEVTRRTHQMALMGFVGKIGNVHNNKFRKLLDEFIRKIPVDYFIGFLTDERRQCIYLQSGELLKTYYDLTDVARRVYTIPMPEALYDVVWLNAYPKDTELLQIDTAFNPVLSAEEKFWHETTVFVVSAACHKGMGVHDLFGPGGALYRAPREKRLLKGHPVLFLLPTISREAFTKVFWEGYQLFNHPEEVILKIEELFSKPNLRSGIFPVASIQLTAP